MSEKKERLIEIAGELAVEELIQELRHQQSCCGDCPDEDAPGRYHSDLCTVRLLDAVLHDREAEAKRVEEAEQEVVECHQDLSNRRSGCWTYSRDSGRVALPSACTICRRRLGSQV